MELLLDTRLCCQPAIPGDIIQFLISIFLYIYLHLKSTIFIPTTPNPGLVAWQLDHSLHYSTKIKCFVLYFVPGIIPSFNNIISVLPSSPPPVHQSWMRQTFVLRSTFGAIIWINDKLHNKIFTWSAQASCLLQYLEPFGAKQRAKMKHNSQIPLHQHFPSLTVLTELECPKKTPTTFLQQLQCTDFATEPM